MCHGKYSVVGTGFYINADGLFVTARHCFEEAPGHIGRGPFGILHFMPDDQYLLRPVMRAWHSGFADVSLGVAAPMTHNKTGSPLRNDVLVLTTERPPLGHNICTYAYAGATVSYEGKETSIHLTPDFYERRLLNYHPHHRDAAAISWPVYETDMHIHGGASGGPVIGERGTAFAINTSSIEGQPDVSYITPVDLILDGEIADARFSDAEPSGAKTLRELIERGLVVFDPPFPSRDLK